MAKTTKVIVTNARALQAKYTNDYPRVEAAIAALIKADARKGMTTRLVALDDPRAMKRLGGRGIEDVDDRRGTKEAIDAVWDALAPDYIMILGAPDIVSHQQLINPMYKPGEDDDRYAPSDLPYACDAPYGQQIPDFRGPTRVVGRLPDLNGIGSLRYIERVLQVASTYRLRSNASYSRYFGLTALEWRKSTQMSLAKTFGDYDHMHRSPTQGPGWTHEQLRPLAHFINCHGGSASPEFYGQRGASYPVSIDADRLRGKIRNGTIVAAECCYGAQLFDPAVLESDRMGICNTYLEQGAYAFFGSTTIAYGPSSGNGSADLVCQEFIQRVLAGASTGRAALEARLQFIMQATHLDPSDLKTLAQFNLMGDPSITVVGKAGHALDNTRVYALAFAYRQEEIARAQRRKRLIRDGSMLQKTIGAAHRSDRIRTPKHIRKALEGAVRNAKQKPGDALAYRVDDPAGDTIGRDKVASTKPTAFHVMHASEQVAGTRHKRHVVIIATEQDGQIVRLRRLHRRG